MGPREFYLTRKLHEEIWQVAAPSDFATLSTRTQRKQSTRLDWNPFWIFTIKVENILKGSLDSIPSPSPSMKIQITGGKVCLRCKGKTLLGNVNKPSVSKSLLTMPSTSSNLFRPWFEFSLKVMGSNPDYLLKSFLLYNVPVQVLWKIISKMFPLYSMLK